MKLTYPLHMYKYCTTCMKKDEINYYYYYLIFSNVTGIHSDNEEYREI